jgi:hypothetical protein
MMHTKIVILLLAGHSILQGQSSVPAGNQQNGPIQCVELSQWPQVSAEESNPGGTVVTGIRESTTLIYTYYNQVLIRSGYYFDSAFDNAGRPAFTELRHRTMVFTKGSMYGSYTDERFKLLDVKVNTETFLAGEWIFQQQYLYDSIAGGAVTFTGSNRISGTDTLKESYHCINPAGKSTTADLQLYFTGKQPGSSFSLCPRLDSMKQQRLCRIVYTFNDTGGSRQKNQPDSYSISLAMKPIPVADKDTAAIMAIFRRDKWADK